MKQGWSGIISDYRISSRRGSGGKNIEINCPMCFDDPSFHLGLMVDGTRFGCWRDPTHKGGSYSSVKRLVSLLLKVPLDKAASIVESYFSISDWMHSGEGAEHPGRKINYVSKPEQFHPFTFDNPEEGRFIQYLQERNFDPKQIINRYNLHWCNYGPFAKRIIIPVMSNKHWLSWTGRSIEGKGALRYKAAGEPDNAPEPNEFVHDYENLSGGKLLVVNEGFFDSARINLTMMPGVQATCLFGQKAEAKQLTALIELAPFYKRILISFDQKAAKSAIRLVERLSYYTSNCSVKMASDKLDWGSSSPDFVIKEFKSYMATVGI